MSDLSHLPAEELDKLISDRPESCRRPGKPGEPEAPVLTHATTVAMAHSCLAVSQLPPQPLMTLSLQSVPLHHQVQPQAHLTPDSPAPAQTPPLHALQHLSPSPLPQPTVGRAPVDFINISTDMNTEVDALDPSIMDFALQGEAGGSGGGAQRGEGQPGGGAARKVREGKGKEGGLHLPHSASLQKTLPNHLILANSSKHLVSTCGIPGLVPSTSEAPSCNSPGRPLPFHIPILPMRKLRPRGVKSLA